MADKPVSLAERIAACCNDPMCCHGCDDPFCTIHMAGPVHALEAEVMELEQGLTLMRGLYQGGVKQWCDDEDRRRAAEAARDKAEHLFDVLSKDVKDWSAGANIASKQRDEFLEKLRLWKHTYKSANGSLMERAESAEARVKALEASRDGWRRDAKEGMGNLRREFEAHLAVERKRVETLEEVLRSCPTGYLTGYAQGRAWLKRYAAALAERKP